MNRGSRAVRIQADMESRSFIKWKIIDINVERRYTEQVAFKRPTQKL